MPALEYPERIPGRWWVPQTGRSFTGDFVVDGSIIELCLIEERSEDHIWDRREENYYETLFGELFGAGHVTAYSCLATSEIQTESRLTRRIFRCERAVYGDHVLDIDELTVKSASFSIPDIDIWLRERPYNSSSRAADGISHDFSVNFDLEKEYAVANFDEYKLSIRVHNTPNFLSRDFSIRSKYIITIEYDIVTKITDTYSHVTMIERLFSTLYGRTIRAYNLAIAPAGKANNFLRLLPPPIKSLEENTRDPERIAIKMGNIPCGLSEILDNAKVIFQKYNVICETAIFAERYNKDFNPQNIRRRFLDICHAIEGIAIASKTANILNKDEFKSARSEILEAVQRARKGFINGNPENVIDHECIRRWDRFDKKLNMKLKELNESKLEAKIKAFYSTFQARTICSLGLDNIDIDSIVKTRNYYAHLSQKKPPNLLDIPTMYAASRSLWVLVIIFFLAELGIDEKDAVYALGSTEMHRDIIDLNIFNR